jgi:hypothetical protein
MVKYLKMVHKRSDAVVNIFNRACGLLCQVTTFKEPSSIAIQEWNIFESLRIYLPSPLSGILPMEEAELNTFFHHTSLDSLDSNVYKELMNAKARVEEYKVGLLQLPVSFFLLCANLCQIDEGQALCCSEGYTRRCMDRLNILNSKFVKHSTRFARNKASPEWQMLSEDFCGCLKFIANVANFHGPKSGAANDLVLHTLYEFVPMCKNLICWQLHTKVPRTDEVVVCAYEALAALAKDTYRVNILFEKYDIYDIVRWELSMLETLPKRGALAAVQLIDRSCFGLTSKYLVDIIPLLREPLSKVTRVYIALGSAVRDCNWTLTRCAKLYKETVDPSYEPDKVIDLAVEEFVRSGSKTAHSRASMMISQKITNSTFGGASTAASSKNPVMSALEHVRALNDQSAFSPAPSPSEKAFAQSTKSNKYNLIRAATTSNIATASAAAGAMATIATAAAVSKGVYTGNVVTTGTVGGFGNHTNRKFKPPVLQPVASEEGGNDYEVPELRPGTYIHCGVGSCGSLLLPHTHSGHQHHHAHAHSHTHTGGGGHGTMAHLTEAQQKELLLHLSVNDPDDPELMLLSKLSAREKGLQVKLQENKIKAGFRDLRRFNSEKKKSSNSANHVDIAETLGFSISESPAPSPMSSPQPANLHKHIHGLPAAHSNTAGTGLGTGTSTTGKFKMAEHWGLSSPAGTGKGAEPTMGRGTPPMSVPTTAASGGGTGGGTGTGTGGGSTAISKDKLSLQLHLLEDPYSSQSKKAATGAGSSSPFSPLASQSSAYDDGRSFQSYSSPAASRGGVRSGQFYSPTNNSNSAGKPKDLSKTFSAATLNTANTQSSALFSRGEPVEKMRTISVNDLPELKFTRPKM